MAQPTHPPAPAPFASHAARAAEGPHLPALSQDAALSQAGSFPSLCFQALSFPVLSPSELAGKTLRRKRGPGSGPPVEPLALHNEPAGPQPGADADDAAVGDELELLCRKVTNTTLNGLAPKHTYDIPDGDPNDIINLFHNPLNVNTVKAALMQDNSAYISQALVRVRKYLSIDMKMENVYFNIEKVLSLDLLERFKFFLESLNDGIIQYETCWIVTNIAAGTSVHTNAIVAAGFIPSLIHLLSSALPLVKTQAAWALGNIAGDSLRFRDLVLNSGMVQPLVHVWRPAEPTTGSPRDPSEESDYRQAQLVSVWCVANLARWKRLDWETLAPTFGLLHHVLLEVDDPEILMETCWALSRVFHGKHELIDRMIDESLCRKLVQLCNRGDSSPNIVNPAIRAITNIASGDDEQTQILVEVGALAVLSKLLYSSDSNIRMEALMAISNIAAGPPSQVIAVHDSGVFGDLIALLKTLVDSDASTGGSRLGETDHKIRREVVWALNNALTNRTAESPKYLEWLHTRAHIQQQILPLILQLLKSTLTSDPTMHYKSSELILNILTSCLPLPGNLLGPAQLPALYTHGTPNTLLLFHSLNGPALVLHLAETMANLIHEHRATTLGGARSPMDARTEAALGKSLDKLREVGQKFCVPDAPGWVSPDDVPGFERPGDAELLGLVQGIQGMEITLGPLTNLMSHLSDTHIN